MKNRFIKLCAIICTLVSMFIFISCTSAQVKKIVMKNVAEVRYNVFEGETEHFSVTFMTGMREDPYSSDGYSNTLVEFGVLTLVSKNTSAIYDTAQKKYALNVDINTYSGDFDINPFDRTLVADVQKVMSDTASISVQINIADITEIIALTNGLENATINYATALDVALTELKPEISALIKNKKLQAEVYIKIITDLNRDFNKFYWYVAIIDRHENTIAVIIDPSSGELVAKRIN